MEAEKITREEIDKARTLLLEFIAAKQNMVQSATELGRKFRSAAGLDLSLWRDWIDFHNVVEFVMEKDALLERRLEKARQAFSTESLKETLECTTARVEEPWPGSN